MGHNPSGEWKKVEFKIDTGADVMVIPKSVFDSLPQAQLEQTKKRLSGPSQKVLPVKGQFKTTISSGDLKVEEEIFVVR